MLYGIALLRQDKYPNEIFLYVDTLYHCYLYTYSAQWRMNNIAGTMKKSTNYPIIDSMTTDDDTYP